ncbi:sigma-70 family RNA polymerase sigma factor [Pseudokineococcus basanitobsidens]|uniref:Sigma-70 family RNA polymerase sigma factor n=1 Tax=Pseudokineococcus basanitobsidens TaxID=1926649 RepID=A0ABU8RI25_9ACTN
MPITSPAAFEDLYGRTVVDVTAYVRRRTHPVQVEDVVAEVYTTAWRRRDDIPTSGGVGPPGAHAATGGDDPARAWLFGVARNHLLAASRGHRRRDRLEIRLAPESATTVPDPATGVGDRDDLRRAWAGLAPGEQEVLSLHLLEELDGAAAARVLGCSRAAYSMRLSRARRHLTRNLTRGTDEHPARRSDAPAGHGSSEPTAHPSTSATPS